MRRLLSPFAAAFAIILLGLIVAAAVMWVRQVVPAVSKADPLPPPPGPPRLLDLAQIPWKNNPAHPEKLPEPIPVGGLPWTASVASPAEVNAHVAVVPWIARPPRDGDDPGAVAIPPALLPWPIANPPPSIGKK